MKRFIGRKNELNQLSKLQQKKTASFIVVRGRRRIGKSRLIEEFAKQFDHFFTFSGLPPEQNTTATDQLNEFSKQLTREMKAPNAIYTDWSDAFWALGERIPNGSTLILFDEISWMGSKDRTFLGKIKNLWDLQLKKNNKLTFVICGSASSWIEKNIMSSSGFVGRISFTLTLEPLRLDECALFWPKHISAYEIFKVLAVTGGVPKYLEEVLPKQTAEDNINRLCFEKGGFLVHEFEQIFADIFLRESQYYREIIETLANGSLSQQEISDALNIQRHGRIPEYLNELEAAGFITKDTLWHLDSGEDAKLRKYRLSDNYLRFYLKYIIKQRSKIDRNTYAIKSISSLSQWSTIMGLQFENLILNSRAELHQTLGIKAEDIISENPYYQRKTKSKQGCQIDYMIQTKFDTLFICEIKFSKNTIGCDVIKEVQEKTKRLKRPKGMSCRPVLIHVNGVTEELIDEDYFMHIIDFSALLKRGPE